MRRYDVIVLGLGGMGSAALWHLASRSVNVLGIEQFHIAHDRGSSHGETRIIRKAYFESPEYVPLVERSQKMWAELEAACGTELFHQTGLLLLGRPTGVLNPGVRLAARKYDLVTEDLTLDEVRSRFPGFMPGEGMEAIFEPQAGFLRVEACVQAHAEQAAARGATLVTGQRVEEWEVDGSGVRVRTKSDVFAADRLIICGGPWSATLLADLGLPLEVHRKPVFWLATADDTYSVHRGSPIFAFDTDHGFFYGFPELNRDGVKVAEHFHRQIVADPNLIERTVAPNEATPVIHFVTEHMPSLTTRVLRTSVCMYTMTPDEHFIIDRHPHHPQVVFAAGFSGHGFKFAPIIGSVLADLALNGCTDQPVSFLSLSRFV